MTVAEQPFEIQDDSAVVRRAVAENLRRARRSRGISMRELAAESGISPSLLSQIERESANPTLAVLSKIASALDLGFADLTRVVLAEPEIIRGVHDEPRAPQVRALFDVYDRRRFDISEGVFPAGIKGSFGAHGKGSVEHSYVVSGLAVLSVGGEQWHLAAGDAVRFDASEQHSYGTLDQPAKILSVVTFQEE